MSRFSFSPPLLHALAVLAARFRVFVVVTRGLTEACGRRLRRGMDGGVLGLRQGHEVFRGVVLAVAVYVMHILIRAQSTTVRLLPYKTVLAYISVAIRKVAVWRIDEHVTANIDFSPALPSICAPALRVMAMDESKRVALVLPPLGAGLFSKLRFSATPTFTETGWGNPIGWRLNHEFLTALSVFSRSLVMARQISGWLVRVVWLLRNLRSTPALA